jgi:glyoxylase I family protein
MLQTSWLDACADDDSNSCSSSVGHTVVMAIKGMTHVSLSVTDLERSVGFYRDVLGLPVFVERFDGGSVFDGEEVMLLAGRTALCLQAHTANSGDRFDPRRTGLDHLALAVGSMDDLEEYATRLTELGIDHSGIRPITTFGHFIELRDPDGIQIELHLLGHG